MKDDRDRWRSLAEELGLPPEPAKPQKSEPPPAPPSAPAREPEPAPQAREPEPRVRKSPEPEPPPLERTEPEVISIEAVTIELRPFTPQAEPETPGTDVAETLPPITSLDAPHLDSMLAGPSADRLPEPGFLEESGGEERPRGRGRRGRRRRGDRDRGERDRSETPAAETGGAEAEAPSEAPRGRRGRGRRPEPIPEPEPDLDELLSEEEPVENGAEQEEEVDDGPEDNLADLNVPSWADLIASLHRPER